MMRSNSPLSWGNYRAAKRKSPKLLVYAHVSPLGSPFALDDPVTVTNPDAPKAGLARSQPEPTNSFQYPAQHFPGYQHLSRLENFLAWRTNRPPVLIILV